jgi:Tol biopolymer transport system component
VSGSGGAQDQINTSGQVRSFAWSPDNLSILYIAEEQKAGINELFTASFDGENITKISSINQDDGDVITARWSSDGMSLAYVADQDINDIYELYVGDISGVNPPEKISGPLQELGDVAGFIWRY